MQNNIRYGRAKQTNLKLGKEVEDLNVRYLNGKQDGYITSISSDPVRTKVKYVLENGQPVFIKSIEKKGLYLTCEIKQSAPNGICMVQSVERKECYFGKWKDNILKDLVVYKRVENVDFSELREIRNFIFNQCTQKNNDESSQVLITVGLQPDGVVTGQNTDRQSKFQSEIDYTSIVD